MTRIIWRICVILTAALLLALLPDIITCRRFALHDAAELKDHLLDLSTSEEAGKIYDAYLSSFSNPDGTVN